MSNGINTKTAPQGRVDLLGRTEEVAEQPVVPAEPQGEKPLNLNLPRGWAAANPERQMPARLTGDQTPASKLETAAAQIAAGGIRGAMGPLMEEGIRGETHDRSLSYLRDNLTRSGMMPTMNARDTLHWAAGAMQGYLPAAQAMHKAGASTVERILTGTLAAATVGVAIEGSQGLKGNPITGKGTHAMSGNDALGHTMIGGAIAGETLFQLHELARGQAKATRNPLWEAAASLTNSERVQINPLFINKDGKTKVGGAQVTVRIPF